MGIVMSIISLVLPFMVGVSLGLTLDFSQKSDSIKEIPPKNPTKYEPSLVELLMVNSNDFHPITL